VQERLNAAGIREKFGELAVSYAENSPDFPGSGGQELQLPRGALKNRADRPGRVRFRE
jgi:hypothetical protein